MADESTIADRSTDVLTYTLLVDGEEVSREYGVLSIIVSKEVNRIPWAKIIIRDGGVEPESFTASDSDIFVPGKEMEIKAGYHSDENTLFKGIIIKHGIKINSSSSTLVVECKDMAVKMTSIKKSACYTETTDSDLITDIIGQYSLEADVEDTSFEHPELIKYNCTDWDFIISRAEANGLIAVADDGKLSVVPPSMDQESLFVLRHGATIIEFEAEMDATNQISSVKGFTWDFANQELLEEEGTDPGYTEQGNFTRDELTSIIHSDDYKLYHGGDMESEQLVAWANAQLIKSSLAKIRGRVRFKGYADIKPNNIVTLEGVGDRFNGDAFVSAVVHQIFQGTWTTDIQLGMSPNWFFKNTDVNDTPAAGLLPAINGLHIGKVVQIGEDDKEGYHRVMVKIPYIEDDGATDAKGYWARMCNVFAGEERGMIFRPEIDDEVILGFVNDDPRDPIVLGALNSNKFPAPIEANDDNFEKGIYTLGKMKLVFNDDEKSITLSTESGNSVLLSEDEGGIVIVDENDNSIKLSSDGINIESAKDIILKASGDIKLEGNNIEQKANMNFKAEGSAGAEVSASGNTVIKGAMVQIN